MKHTVIFTDGVVKRTGMSESWISRELDKRRKGQGNFPLPISPFKSKRRWLESDIDNYIASLASVNTDVPVPTKNKKQQEREFIERQNRAKQALARHGIAVDDKTT